MADFMQSYKGICDKCGECDHKGVRYPNEANKQNPSTEQHFNRVCHHRGMNCPRISVCRKLKAERTKAQQEKAYLAQGKGDKDHYGFLVDSDMESIDELG